MTMVIGWLMTYKLVVMCYNHGYNSPTVELKVSAASRVLATATDSRPMPSQRLARSARQPQATPRVMWRQTVPQAIQGGLRTHTKSTLPQGGDPPPNAHSA